MSDRSKEMHGGGFATASGGIRWLLLAAAPTFALMAFLTAANSEADVICSAMAQSFPLGSMAAMYLLMALFHLPPWLRLFSGSRRQS